MKSGKPEVRRSPVVEKLPEDIAAGIGHIIARFSRLEDVLRTMAYAAIPVDPKRGRIAIRQPRLEDQVTMVEDLLILWDIKPPIEFARLKKDVAAAERDRDKFAHGIFVTHPETHQLAVRVTTGNYKVEATEPRRTRRMLPEGEEFGRPELDAIAASIEDVIARAKTLVTVVLALRTSQEKLREQGPPANPPRGQT